MSNYTPSAEILKKYADVLVNAALWSGEGIKPGDVVFCSVPECAKPIFLPLQESILQAGGHPVMQFVADGVQRHFFEHANDHQLAYMPNNYYLGMVQDATHRIVIIAEDDKHHLAGIDPQKIMKRHGASKIWRDEFFSKEGRGELTWTLALYGTPAMAEEANMSLEEYRHQIIHACYLDYEDPVSEWRSFFTIQEKIKNGLNALSIESVHVVGPDVDLTVKLGSDRQWLGGTGRNIPSFELFVSPHRAGTQGWMKFNQPLYYHGNMIDGIFLRFEQGVCVEARASSNEKLLQEMIAMPHADKLGEFSLTDKRFSRISRFMGETLYDENIGGEYGNCHVALGMAYKDSYRGDGSVFTQQDWIDLGFNDSVVHTDIVSTSPRTVTATLTDGTQKIIYDQGMFADRLYQ